VPNPQGSLIELEPRDISNQTRQRTARGWVKRVLVFAAFKARNDFLRVGLAGHPLFGGLWRAVLLCSPNHRAVADCLHHKPTTQWTRGTDTSRVCQDEPEEQFNRTVSLDSDLSWGKGHDGDVAGCRVPNVEVLGRGRRMRRAYLNLRRRLADRGMPVHPARPSAVPHDHLRLRTTTAMH